MCIRDHIFFKIPKYFFVTDTRQTQDRHETLDIRCVYTSKSKCAGYPSCHRDKARGSYKEYGPATCRSWAIMSRDTKGTVRKLSKMEKDRAQAQIY